MGGGIINHELGLMVHFLLIHHTLGVAILFLFNSVDQVNLSVFLIMVVEADGNPHKI